MIRTAAVTLCLILLAGGLATRGRSENPRTEGSNITTHITCIQIDKSELTKIEKNLGFHFNAPDGKVLLTTEERRKLLDAIENADSAEILGSETVTSLPGCQCAIGTEEQEAVRFPTRYKLERTSDGLKYALHDFEERSTGLSGGLSITEVENTDLISIAFFIDMARFIDWNTFEEGVSQPVFKTWSLSSTIVIPDSMTYISKHIPPSSFAQSAVVPQDTRDSANQTKCCLFLLSVRKQPD